ncbi:MAG: phosphoadenylyl-sulfate reductase [Anaerolineae bacterium]
MTLGIASYLSLHAQKAKPQDILAWAWETFAPAIAATSSFQTQSVPLLHLIAQVCPEMPVVFIDTGFHFPETLAFRNALVERLGLNLEVVRPELGPEELTLTYGEDLYRHDPDLCCYLNKVQPLERALEGRCAWVSGVRHDQTRHRRHLHDLDPQISGVIKIHPLLHWTHEQVEAYREEHKLPAHPLHQLGYLSVGCAPCTQPVLRPQDKRSGRWRGEKEECGIHLDPRSLKDLRAR